MKTQSYRVKNRITGEEADSIAESAEEACEKLGWAIGDCYVLDHRQHRLWSSRRKIIK